MPDLTYNLITLAGDPADVAAALAALNSDHGVLDFNTLIPMPPLLRHTASGGRTLDDDTLHRAWFIENPEASLTEQIARPFTADERAALAAIGFDNWYDWCTAHWGTKWNALRAEFPDGYTPGDRCASIRFDTAWCMPEGICDALFDRFPRLHLSWSWTNETDDDGREYCIERPALDRDDPQAA